jgi:hypothetical protein
LDINLQYGKYYPWTTIGSSSGVNFSTMGIARISLLESNEITEVQQGFKTERTAATPYYNSCKNRCRGSILRGAPKPKPA